MTFHRASRYTLALALLALPAVAGAQAFGLNEIGTCALGRGFAVTGAPCDDASSIYWNPGAMPSKSGFSFLGGAAIIALKGDFTRDTSFRRYDADVPTEVVPHLFLNYRSGRAAYGIGLYVPYGLTSQWRDDFPGRFSAKKASLQTIYIQPNISYQITDNWSIGGGPVIGHSTVELIQALDLSAQSPLPGVTFGQLGIAKYTEFGRANLKGSAMAYGFDVGIHGKVGKDWQTGLRVLSQLSFNYDDADATFTQTLTGIVLPATLNAALPAGTQFDTLLAKQFTTGGPLTAQKVKTKIRHPAQIQVGVGYTGFEKTTLSVDYAYVGWKSFNQLPVDFQGSAPDRMLQEDYNNTSSIRLGAERRYSGGKALRLGFAATTSAAPPETVTPLLPEQDRELGMIGGALPLVSGLVLDATYSHIFTPGSRGRIDERTPGMTSAQALALNSGAYTLSANIFSFSLKYSF
ncbi:MAG: rane protein involved in aromatic hydrocarbon degradation [Gemmatimonadetes bacterium]|nr:rane protein involved in aromatic hydrocarbon degradation [Gemmatimonadota bacterium]